MDIRQALDAPVDSLSSTLWGQEKARLLLLTSGKVSEPILPALSLSCAGSIAKSCSAQEIVAKIRQTRHNISQCSDLIEVRPAGPLTGVAELTWTERQVLEGITQGKTNRTIAAALYLSESSIKKYAHRIFTKLKCSRRAEAAALYAQYMVSRTTCNLRQDASQEARGDLKEYGKGTTGP